jgi:beta-galactosidase
LTKLSDYVRKGGHMVMAFKSGFTDEHSTVRDAMAPGPLRAAAGFHYQEFTNLAAPERLTPDAYSVGDQNSGSIWEEFLVPDTAEVIASFDDRYWQFPAITRNKYGGGTLTYEGTFLTNSLQREVIRDVLERIGVTGPDQNLPPSVKVRHGRNRAGHLLHYYLNFSGEQQVVSYSHNNGSDLLTGASVRQGQSLKLQPWDLAIISEQ